MVEWKPLIGDPPLSAAEWDRVFGLYKKPGIHP